LLIGTIRRRASFEYAFCVRLWKMRSSSRIPMACSGGKIIFFRVPPQFSLRAIGPATRGHRICDRPLQINPGSAPAPGLAAPAPALAAHVPAMAAPAPVLAAHVPTLAAPTPAVADPAPAMAAATLAAPAVAAAAPALAAPAPALAAPARAVAALASPDLTHAVAAASSGGAATPTFFALAAAAAAAAATATTDAECAPVWRLTTVVPDAAASLACRLGPEAVAAASVRTPWYAPLGDL